MGFLRTAWDWLTYAEREATPPSDPSTAITAPWRTADRTAVTSDSALTISMVYRAIQIHATAVAQLSLDVERRGVKLSTAPLLVRKPDVNLTRSEFLEQCTVSMATTGNAYWRLIRDDNRDPESPVRAVEALNPKGMAIFTDPATGRRTYSYADERGTRTLQDWQVKHLRLMTVGSNPYGLGPIQAAQVELRGALELRDYASLWFTDAGVPSGVLSTDQPLNDTQAEAYKTRWHETAGGVRVLGHGLSYAAIYLSPRDAQFLESQQFTTTQIARLFGIPASLFLANVEGSSETYANVEQDWIAYVRFSLMAYLRKIEDALSSLLPAGQQVRFNVEGLLRTDTKTRYEAHEIALRAGWTDVAEVRDIEGLPPRQITPPAAQEAPRA